MKNWCLKSIALALLIVSTQARAWSADQNIRLSQYVHTAWRLQDGTFDSIPYRVAQTNDGYLWVGTLTGLLRFDGVHFVPWTLPPEARLPVWGVTALTATADGSLWIGTGTLVRLKNGGFTIYNQINGRALAILDDLEGGVWVARFQSGDGLGPLCQVSDVKVKCFRAENGITFDQANTLFRDKNGVLWLAGSYAIAAGRSPSFRSFSLPSSAAVRQITNVSGLLDGPDGSILVGRGFSGKDGGLQEYRDGHGTPYKVQNLDGSLLRVEVLRRFRDGSLWIGTTAEGVVVVRGQRVEHFGLSDGLSSDHVNDIQEDREGNVWITTSGGLDRFRMPKVITFSRREGLSSDSAAPVLAARDGTIYVGNNDGLDEIRDSSISSIRAAQGLPGKRVTGLLEDHAGRLWVSVDQTLAVLEGGHFRTIHRGDDIPTGHVCDTVEDDRGDIWGLNMGHALMRVHGNVVAKASFRSAGPSVRAIGKGADRTVIVINDDGAIGTYKDGALKTVVPVGGGPRLLDPIQLADGHLVGYSLGFFTGFQDGKARQLGTHNGLPCNEMISFVQDKEDALWLYMSCGLVSIDKTELERFWKDPNAKLAYRLFDSFEGVHAGRPGFRPRAALGSDGKLWFVNGQTVQMIDPKNIATNGLLPPVHIESVTADRKTYLPESSLSLPRLTRDVQIDYTALSLVIPEKVYFRYRLEGRDKDWQEPGTRRQAFYTDLPPGQYHFHVIASNNDGVWNTTGAFLNFFIPPAFYQTIWFKCLLVVVAACLVWVLYVLRLRKATAEITARLGERLQERERIARELHDTLLQDFQAIILRFDGVFRRLVSGDPNRLAMDEGLRYADSVLREGRNRIRDIRADTKAPQDLAKAFSDYSNELSQLRPVRFDVKVTGAQIEIDPIVRDEIYRIGREAVGNAFKHSECSKIEVELAYAPREFQLSVRDDGKGIDPAILTAGGKPGHWGMYNMRERAQKIGASLEFSSTPNAGTTLELKLPLSSFKKSLASWFPWRRRTTSTGLSN